MYCLISHVFFTVNHRSQWAMASQGQGAAGRTMPWRCRPGHGRFSASWPDFCLETLGNFGIISTPLDVGELCKTRTKLPSVSWVGLIFKNGRTCSCWKSNWRTGSNSVWIEQLINVQNLYVTGMWMIYVFSELIQHAVKSWLLYSRLTNKNVYIKSSTKN